MTCLEGALDSEVRERVDARGRAQIDAAAMTAVATIRPAERHELLAPKAGATAPAVAGVDFQFGFIDELHLRFKPDWAKRPSIAGRLKKSFMGAT